MAKYAVVRTDNMFGTDVRAGLVSLKYMGAEGSTPTEIQNGSVVLLDSLMEGEREVFKAKDPTGNEAMKDIALVASPEVMYDERKRNLDEFVNETGKIARGYHLHNGDFFSVTAEALDGSPSVGNVVELQAGPKLKVVGSATSGKTTIGTIHAIETAGRYKYYVVKVGEVAAAAGE